VKTKSLIKGRVDLLQGLYKWTPYIPNLFNFSKRISGHLFDSKFLTLIQYWQEHEGEFEFTADGHAVLKELNITCKIDESIPFFNLFFKTRDKYNFFSKNGQVYMEIGGFTFLLNFPHGICELLEVFQDKCYEIFDIKNKVVVDIGAFIGDSAIYFAGKGAKKIVAYEPNPHIFEIAKKNVQLNNLTNKIQVRQKAVSNKMGVRTFMFNTVYPSGSSMHFKLEDTIKFQVNTIPFSSITQELGHIGLLKLDCEGAEYEILPAAYKEGALRNVDKIVMEVHGPVEPIIDVLHRAEFKVTKNQKTAFSPIFNTYMNFISAEK
jgi:FkbM family methyltransferase